MHLRAGLTTVGDLKICTARFYALGYSRFLNNETRRARATTLPRGPAAYKSPRPATPGATS